MDSKENDMKAITTKFLSATATKPARVKATCGSKSVTISRDSFDSDRKAHQGAVRTLCEKMNWRGVLVGAPTDEGNVFVLDDNRMKIKVGPTDYIVDVDNPRLCFGTEYPVTEFIKCCATGLFIDSNGYGHPAKDGKFDPHTHIVPSRLYEIPHDATSIVWYNK